VRHRLEEPVVEQLTVGQSGERIELRQPLEALLRSLALDGDGQCVRNALQKARVVRPKCASVRECELNMP